MSLSPASQPNVPHLQVVVARLVAAFQPQQIILFGSWARGDAREGSDIDLLVVADTSEPMHVRMARAQRALRGLAIPVDVFIYTPEEVGRYRSWLSHTVSIALREGMQVHAA